MLPLQFLFIVFVTFFLKSFLSHAQTTINCEESFECFQQTIITNWTHYGPIECYGVGSCSMSSITNIDFNRSNNDDGVYCRGSRSCQSLSSLVSNTTSRPLIRGFLALAWSQSVILQSTHIMTSQCVIFAVTHLINKIQTTT